MLCRRQVKCEKRSGRRVDRIQVDSPAEKLDRSIDVSACYLKIGRCDHDGRIGGSQRQCLAQCLSRPVQIEIEIRLDRGTGEQPFRQVRLNGESPRRCVSCTGQMGVETFLPSRGRETT